MLIEFVMKGLRLAICLPEQGNVAEYVCLLMVGKPGLQKKQRNFRLRGLVNVCVMK